MLTGIILGVLGFLCAIFLTILGGVRNPKGDFGASCFAWAFRRRFIYAGGASSLLLQAHGRSFFTVILLFAVARGILHYGEQYCNHYIAFRILAIIRHKVFAILRNSARQSWRERKRGISSPSLLRTSNS